MKEPLVGQSGLTTGLQRVLDTSGDGFGYITPKLVGTIQALDLTDHQYLKPQSINSYCVGARPTVQAARFCGVILSNVAAGQKIVTIRRIVVSAPGATMDIAAYVGAVAVPAIANPVVQAAAMRDSRQIDPTGVAMATQCIVTDGNFAGAGQGGLIFQLVAGQVVALQMAMTIGPGGFFNIRGSVANQTFLYGIEWDERQAVTPEYTMPSAG
jgi:hypothetical protein